MTQKRKRIGTYHLGQKTQFSKAFEYAGACEVVECEAGDYPVNEIDGIYGGKFISIDFEGILIYSSFVNRLGAACNVRESAPMTENIYSMQPRRYELEKLVESGLVTMGAII